MLGMWLSHNQGGFDEKTLQNVAFVIFLLLPGMTERVLRRYYNRRRRLFTCQRAAAARGRAANKVGPPLIERFGDRDEA